MLRLTEDRYSIVSFLTLFVIVQLTALSHSGSEIENYEEFLFQAIIFSIMIAFPIACCFVLARGTVRDPKELTDGLSVYK